MKVTVCGEAVIFNPVFQTLMFVTTGPFCQSTSPVFAVHSSVLLLFLFIFKRAVAVITVATERSQAKYK